MARNTIRSVIFNGTPVLKPDISFASMGKPGIWVFLPPQCKQLHKTNDNSKGNFMIQWFIGGVQVITGSILTTGIFRFKSKVNDDFLTNMPYVMNYGIFVSNRG